MAEKDLVEAIARAYAREQHVDPDQEGPGRVTVADVEGVPTIISDHRGPLWKMWGGHARAALQAIEDAGYDLVKRDDILETSRRAQQQLRPHFEGGKGKEG